MLKEQGSLTGKFYYQKKFHLTLTSAKQALFITKKRFLIEKLENVPKLKIPKVLATNKCSKVWCISFLFFLFFPFCSLILMLGWVALLKCARANFHNFLKQQRKKKKKKGLWGVTILYFGVFYRMSLGTLSVEV